VSAAQGDAILAVFRRQLREEKLGPDDNFFEHGGHSLIAFRVLAELRRLFAVTPLLEDFAELSTARKMADWLRHQNEDGEDEDSEDEDDGACQFARPVPGSKAP